MTNLWITVPLVGCICCLVVLQIFGRESLNRDKAGALISRITGLGWIRIALAVAALLLIALNEYSAREFHKKFFYHAKISQETLQNYVESANENMKNMKKTFKNIERESDGIIYLVANLVEIEWKLLKSENILFNAFVSSDHFDIPLFELMSGTQHGISTIVGKTISIAKGDFIEWAFHCPGELSSTVQQAATGVCSLDGLGTFQAYGERVPMNRLTGKQLLRGTRSNDGQFLFRTACHRVHSHIKNAQCTVKVTIAAPAMDKFYDVVDKSKPTSDEFLDNLIKYLVTYRASRACLMFESLSGRSCGKDVKALLRSRGF